MFSRMVSLKRSVSWVTSAIWARRLASVTSRRSTPSMMIRPPIESEARQQVRQGGLAAARRADERDHLALADLELEAVQHRPVAVGERDPLEPDRVAERRRGALVPASGTGLGASRISKIRSPAAAPSSAIWPTRPSCFTGV